MEMEEMVWPDLENSTDDGNAAPSSTAATSTAWQHAGKQSVSAKVVV